MRSVIWFSHSSFFCFCCLLRFIVVLFPFNGNGIAFSKACFFPSGSNWLGIVCILRWGRRKPCSVFIHMSKPKVLFVVHFIYVTLQHKNITMKCYGIGLLRRKLKHTLGFLACYVHLSTLISCITAMCSSPLSTHLCSETIKTCFPFGYAFSFVLGYCQDLIRILQMTCSPTQDKQDL